MWAKIQHTTLYDAFCFNQNSRPEPQLIRAAYNVKIAEILIRASFFLFYQPTISNACVMK